MAKKKVVHEINTYTPPPDNEFWFYIGEQYYRRMQPTPYKASKINLDYYKNILGIKNK
jgi:hypothetical protein